MIKDALIVGAGPTGLMMALCLKRLGMDCRIIDQSNGPSEKSKALAIQPRTLEIFDHLGIVENFLAQGLKIPAFEIFSDQKEIAGVYFEFIDSPFQFVLSLEQSKTEKILTTILESLGCFVEREMELIAFKQDHTGVTATLKDHKTDQTEECRTSWLIGCDGAHSTIRNSLNLLFEGATFPDILSIADIQMEWKFSHEKGRVFLKEDRFLVVIPLPAENQYRLIFVLDRVIQFLKQKKSIEHGEIDRSELAPPTLDEVQELVRNFTDPSAMLKNPIWLTNFGINSRMVKDYRINRIFLAGDASHIHSPMGGQGMNTGLQDAFNLAWKLSFVHQGITSVSLLESYQSERHSVGKKLLRGTELATKLGPLLKIKWLCKLRNVILTTLSRYRFLTKRIANAVTELNIKYEKSRWVVQRGPTKYQAGMRAPPHWIPKKSTQPILIIDGSFSYPKVLVQSIESDAIYLVRPDGYIGYAGPKKDLESLNRYLDQFFNVNY